MNPFETRVLVLIALGLLVPSPSVGANDTSTPLANAIEIDLSHGPVKVLESVRVECAHVADCLFAELERSPNLGLHETRSVYSQEAGQLVVHIPEAGLDANEAAPATDQGGAFSWTAARIYDPQFYGPSITQYVLRSEATTVTIRSYQVDPPTAIVRSWTGNGAGVLQRDQMMAQDRIETDPGLGGPGRSDSRRSYHGVINTQLGLVGEWTDQMVSTTFCTAFDPTCAVITEAGYDESIVTTPSGIVVRSCQRTTETGNVGDCPDTFLGEAGAWHVDYPVRVRYGPLSSSPVMLWADIAPDGS